jgi:hypothetical protein
MMFQDSRVSKITIYYYNSILVIEKHFFIGCYLFFINDGMIFL